MKFNLATRYIKLELQTEQQLPDGGMTNWLHGLARRQLSGLAA